MKTNALRARAVSGVAVAAVLGTGAAHAASLGLPETGSLGGTVDSSRAGMVLNVTNSSTYDLQWVGGSGPASTPLAVIPAGGTDRIVWHGTNLELEPTWQVVGTEYNVFPKFGVPLIGGNATVCTIDEISRNSPVGMSHCDIGHGWDPDAHVTFADVH